MNLGDIMESAWGRGGFETFGRPFGLTADQIAKVVEAVLPAFSTGLKRSVADPFSFPELMKRFGMDRYGQSYRNPGWAIAEGPKVGQELLGLLFGSGGVERAVAEQASAVTGVAADTLMKMLPALAASVLGGLQQRVYDGLRGGMVRQAEARDATSPKPAGKGPLDRYEEEQDNRARLKASADAMAQLQPEAMRLTLEAMTAGATGWADLMAQMAKSASGAGGEDDGRLADARPSFPPAFADMLEPGLALGETYRRGIEAIFDGFGNKR